MRFVYDPVHDDGLDDERMVTRDIYLAGPFFSIEQAGEISGVEIDVRAAGFTVFSPRLECRYRTGDPPIVAERAFFLNRYHINTCKFILACLSWPDAGTAWELGYADAMIKPRIAFTSNPRVGMNLMAVKTCQSLVLRSHLAACLKVIKTDMDRGRMPLPAIQRVDMLENWVGELE